MSIAGTGILGTNTTVLLNGNTQVITLANMTSNVTQLHYKCNIEDSGIYNVAIWVTD